MPILSLTLIPNFQKSTDSDQLTDVVRAVIRYQNQFSKIGLTLTMGNPCSKVKLRIRRQRFESVPVTPILANAFVPRCR